MKDVEFLIDDLSQPSAFVAQLRTLRIHIAVGITNRLWFVMRPQRFVVAKSDRD